MTHVKIQGKPRAAAAGPIEARADWLWHHPGGRAIGVVELVHTERSEPAPDEQKDKTVTLTISLLELAPAEQEEILRQAARALFLQRTAQGTFDELSDEFTLSQATLKQLTGQLFEQAAATSRAQLAHWADYAHRVFTTPNLRDTELRHELQIIADGLHAAAYGLRRQEDES